MADKKRTIRGLTTHQVADRLGITHDLVGRYIRMGNLRARKFGRDWLISPAELARFARQPRPVGRPPVDG